MKDSIITPPVQVTVFSTLAIDVAGSGYTLIATIVGGSVTKESAPFNITVL